MDVLFCETAADWRAWLEANHDSAPEVELGLRKKGSGLPSVTYSEAVDEALCFGWIDGVAHGIDETSYRQRFTPRKPRSRWSKVNMAKFAALDEAGKIHSAGREAFERGVPADYSFEVESAFTDEQEARLRDDEAAWAYWETCPPGYKRGATHWVVTAKREETRERRLATLIECSREGRRVPPLA